MAVEGRSERRQRKFRHWKQKYQATKILQTETDSECILCQYLMRT
jgi:hypothetical protein